MYNKIMRNGENVEKKPICIETSNGISVFGVNIPYWLIILILLLFIAYMWIENKSPMEVLNLDDEFKFTAVESSPFSATGTPISIKFQ